MGRWELARRGLEDSADGSDVVGSDVVGVGFAVTSEGGTFLSEDVGAVVFAQQDSEDQISNRRGLRVVPR